MTLFETSMTGGLIISTEKLRRIPASLILFYILMAAVAGWFIFSQINGPNERSSIVQNDTLLYSGTLTWEKSDGSKEIITVPGQYDVPARETMVITSTLPADYNETTVAIRSSLQNVSIYIGDEQRVHYDTSATRLAGKNSASRYIFCPTSSADAGKELRIELTSNTEKYSGVVNQIYCGDKVDIWEYIYQTYGLSTIIAFFTLFTGIICIIFSIALSIIYKYKFDTEYLGWCMIMAAGWMLGESKFRQLLVPNASSLSALCFVCIMLCPIPILFYINNIQESRYQKFYRILVYLAFADFVVCSVLEYFGIADYIETLPVGHIIIAITFAAVLSTIISDIRHKNDSKNRLVFIELLIAALAVGIESVSSYLIVSLSGLFIGIGMIALLFINVLRTARQVRNIEINRQKDELNRRNQQMEKMSLQTMQTLCTTIEAKDEYTRGHSHRVAEYAGLIARELGWSSEEIVNLNHAAHLHDIGKIGIPDTILNKPTRLTAEEYAVIKEHPIIGSEILKNITIIKNAAQVAHYHHERYDGTGYPDGLSGEDIPIQARIVAIADSYDVMSSKRIYRNALPENVIIDEIRKGRGTQFDPHIADIFLKLLTEHRLNINKDYLHINDESNLPNIESELEKFISDIVRTMQASEGTESLDFLTGLPMRNRGEKMVAQMMHEHDGYLVFMDMDNLKKINDIYGHKAGDRALKTIGTILSDCMPECVVCRLGGDEFLLFKPNATKGEITDYVRSLFKRFDEQTALDTEISDASMSAGLCMCSKDASFEDCYAKADKALYYVKQNGKDNIFFYQQLELEKTDINIIGKDLSIVATALSESGNYNGALDLNYREFAKIYKYMNHLGTRYKYNCYLVMVTMEQASEDPTYIEKIEIAMNYMEQAIRSKIRSVDICTSYSSLQYLIILFEADERYISKVMDRIFLHYDQLYHCKCFHPSYEYISINKDNK